MHVFGLSGWNCLKNQINHKLYLDRLEKSVIDAIIIVKQCYLLQILIHLQFLLWLKTVCYGTKYLQIVMMLHFPNLFVCFHIIWSRQESFCFISFHSPVIVKETRQARWRQNNSCNLLHGQSETILARTHSWLKLIAISFVSSQLNY